MVTKNTPDPVTDSTMRPILSGDPTVDRALLSLAGVLREIALRPATYEAPEEPSKHTDFKREPSVDIWKGGST